MHPFRIGFNTDQHLPFDELRRRWQLLDALGFDSAWVADHLLPWWIDRETRTTGNVPWDDGVSGDDTPFLEGWTLLAALLARTTRIRGGVLVSDNLFRHPALVAKMAVTIDQISGGRFELGLGAGWFAREHEAYGFDFPGPGERVDRLAEALEVITRLLRDERNTFDGAHHRLADAPLAPRPTQPRIPVVIGGSRPRMLRLVARYADTWNCAGSPAQIAERGAAIADACREIGRDPAAIRWSYYGYNALLGADPFESADAFRQLVEPYRAAGVSEVILELPDTFDERVLRDIAERILPAWRDDR